MTKEEIRAALNKQAQQQLDASVNDKVKDKCVQADGKLIRGFVTKVKCKGCNNMRYDDGTRCMHCGKTLAEILDAEDAGIEGEI